MNSIQILDSVGDSYQSPLHPLRQYYVGRQDDQIEPNLYTRPGLNRPMVFRMQTYGSFPMTEAVQKFLFDLNRTDDEERDRDQFADLYDTWSTNEGKIREGANFITGERLDQPLPRWSHLYCGRNVFCGKETVADGTYDIPFGTRVLEVETLDPLNLPAGLSYETHPHLIHHCNIIVDNKVDGLYQVNPFRSARVTPPYKPAYYGLMGKSGQRLHIEMWKLIKLPLGTMLPNPYNPIWEWK